MLENKVDAASRQRIEDAKTERKVAAVKQKAAILRAARRSEFARVGQVPPEAPRAASDATMNRIGARASEETEYVRKKMQAWNDGAADRAKAARRVPSSKALSTSIAALANDRTLSREAKATAIATLRRMMN